MYSLTGIPYYDHHTQCYKKVLKINKLPPPNTPLYQIVKQVGPIKLSPFQVDSAFSGCQSCNCSNLSSCCNFLITKINNKNELMCVDEISNFFSFLIENGYTIDTSITSMMQKSNVKLSNDLICFFS